MGVISDTVKRVENDLHHHHHHSNHQQQEQEQEQNGEHKAHHQLQQKLQDHQHSRALHDVNAQHPYHPSPLASGFAAGPPSSSSSSALLSDAGGSQQSLRSSRRSSLKIRTDSANQQVTLPPQPMTAGAKPSSPFASPANSQQQKQPQQHRQQQPPHPAPLPASATMPKTTAVAPIMIKRNTSFSQRIHNLLHRDKSQKHQSPQNQGPASPLQMRHAHPAVAGAGASAAGYETPTIAYRTPTTHTTQSSNPSANASATASADNSPPNGVSPHASSSNLNNASVSSTYHAQRNFEPVPHDKVFSMGNTNLRSVQRHNSQIRDSMNMGLVCRENTPGSPQPQKPPSSGSYATDAAVADDLSQAMRDVDIRPSAS
ncbi:hypothetical protein LPJ75_006343, partial [Coemansia sp. RSA 2598]